MGIPCIPWRAYSLYFLYSLACALLSPQLASINRLTLVPGFVSPTGMRHTRGASSSDSCLLNQLINALHTPSRADAQPDAQPESLGLCVGIPGAFAHSGSRHHPPSGLRWIPVCERAYRRVLASMNTPFSQYQRS